MKGPESFGKVMNIIMNVIMCGGMTVYLAIALGIPSETMVPFFAQCFVLAFVVGYTLGDLVPVAALSMKASFTLRKYPVVAYLVQCLIMSVSFAVMLVLVCSFINNITTTGVAGWLGFFVSMIPGVVLVASILVILTMGLAQKAAAAITGFNPKATMASDAA